MLQLQIGFPTGRYHAAEMSDPRRPEWPPHPSRVYSALVAAAYAGGRQPTDAERAALERLEAASPPALSFPDADVRLAADSYVPVNDTKSRVEPPSGKKKLTSHGVLMPNRQVRQFPSAFLLDEPEVSLLWSLHVNDVDLQLLDALAARMTHLGTSHSLVTARFTRPEAPPAARLVPSDHGAVFLRAPSRGRLDELDRLAALGSGTLRRPPPACEVVVTYVTAADVRDLPEVRFDWVCLRLVDASWGADTAHTLARALRRSVLSIMGDGAPQAVHGHDPEVEHVAWLPLPDVGHQHARGRIRGVAVALPLTMDANQRAQTLAALARLQELRLPDGQVATVRPSIEGPETPVVLRGATWRGSSTHWSTVTPVLLDRPPKKHEPERILAALAESIVNAGFPAPVALRAMQHSDFEGSPTALDIPTRVPRFHARVEFAEPVVGPVMAGRWRNFGIGLFRPTPMDLRG